MSIADWSTWLTQRTWETTDGWDVLTGWDRPLQHFFVNIDRKCRNCDGQGGFGEEPNDADQCPVCEASGTEYLFNNLADKEYCDTWGGMSLDQVMQVLHLKLTSYPESLLARLTVDRLQNLGNEVSSYETQGEARPQE